MNKKVIPKKYNILSILSVALAGGVFWSTVRPSGYGSGPSMGLLWGIYWILLMSFLFDQKRFPTQASYVLLVFIIGFALGGMQGYGQFNQWMTGRFYLDTQSGEYIGISRFYGFYHLFICGLTWGGFPALFLAWVFCSQNNYKRWIERLLVGIIGFMVFQLLIGYYPQIFLPFYNKGYYSDASLCLDCQRTIDTAKNTYGFLGSFLFLSFFTLTRNNKTKYFILPISLGFAISFSFAGFLHSLQVVPELSTYPWWKMWEFMCGFGGGLSLFFSFWLVQKKEIFKAFTMKYEGKEAKKLWWGFWIPLLVAIGILTRDRIHQIAKVYVIMYGIDLTSEFIYLEIAAIIITLMYFLYKLIQFKKNNENLDTLLVDRPKLFYLLLYSGFFWLSMIRWIYIPFTFEKNIITLLALIAYSISVALFVIMIKNQNKLGHDKETK